MAVISVPRVLREKLGDEAADGLAGLFAQVAAEQKDQLFGLLEERFARRVQESEENLRGEMHAGFLDVQKQLGDVRAEMGSVRAELGNEIGSVRAELGKEIGSVRAELGKEIGSVRAELGKEIGSVRAELSKEIRDLRKEITVQTRWILAVLVAAAVLIPIVQRVMEALLP